MTMFPVYYRLKANVSIRINEVTIISDSKNQWRAVSTIITEGESMNWKDVVSSLALS